jgi:SAM-dependent methyltransferase
MTSVDTGCDILEKPGGEGLSCYRNVALHRNMGLLIRKHSQNKEDIRLIARKALDLTETRTLLDLGCGYGWFEQVLENQFDLVAGIDLHEENREPFLREASRISRKGLFIQERLPAPIDMSSGTFDLIVSIYSLYFFSEILPEVWRLLSPEGTFLSITHSEHMLQDGKGTIQFKSLKRLIERFSAENGESLLKKHFPSVTRIDYHNRLIFNENSGGDLESYLLFKKDLVAGERDLVLVRKSLLGELNKRGTLQLNKDDGVFIAKK